MGDRDAEVAVLNERIKQLREKLDEVGGDLSEMKQMAERYRGGFIVIVALGSIIGMAIQLWELWPWHPK